MSRCLLALGCAGLLLAGTAPARADDSADFQRANELLQQRKYADALQIYETLLKTNPDRPPLLLNMGWAAFGVEHTDRAVQIWTQLETAQPTIWQVHIGLIQAYQQLGKIADRDREQATLQKQWADGKDPELAKMRGYARDRFDLGTHHVVCFQFFKPQGAMGELYEFSSTQTGSAGLEPLRVGVESSDIDTDIAREMKQIGPQDRVYSLDGYTPNGHATYAMYNQKPTYEAIKEQVGKIMSGALKPATSSTVPSP